MGMPAFPGEARVAGFLAPQHADLVNLTKSGLAAVWSQARASARANQTFDMDALVAGNGGPHYHAASKRAWGQMVRAGRTLKPRVENDTNWRWLPDAAAGETFIFGPRYYHKPEKFIHPRDLYSIRLSPLYNLPVRLVSNWNGRYPMNRHFIDFKKRVLGAWGSRQRGMGW